MTTDVPFHYPPELFNLLVDTIPLLNRSKKDVVLFFRGAGVPHNLLEDIAQRLTNAPHEMNKFEITRSVLDRLNARGEATLRERREVLRRVVDFTTFDSCWPDDPAQGQRSGCQCSRGREPEGCVYTNEPSPGTGTPDSFGSG